MWSIISVPAVMTAVAVLAAAAMAIVPVRLRVQQKRDVPAAPCINKHR